MYKIYEMTHSQQEILGIRKISQVSYKFLACKKQVVFLEVKYLRSLMQITRSKKRRGKFSRNIKMVFAEQSFIFKKNSYLYYKLFCCLIFCRQYNFIHSVEIPSDLYVCPPLWTGVFCRVLSLSQERFPDQFHGSNTTTVQHATGISIPNPFYNAQLTPFSKSFSIFQN